MKTELKARIDSLKGEIDAADPSERNLLVEKLEQAVLTLESLGGRAPGWAKSLVDEMVEDQFDNMPI
ncbi:MAG: hypothetical protein N4A70_19400 [Pelagimonas sp.]|nr:hypothetical protein [Pelagimonas sp.]